MSEPPSDPGRRSWSSENYQPSVLDLPPKTPDKKTRHRKNCKKNPKHQPFPHTHSPTKKKKQPFFLLHLGGSSQFRKCLGFPIFLFNAMEFGNFGRGPRLLPYVKGTKTSPMVLNRRRIQVCAGAHPPSLRGSTGWLSSTPLGAEASLTFAGIRIGLAKAVAVFGFPKKPSQRKGREGDHVPQPEGFKSGFKVILEESSFKLDSVTAF